MRDATAKNLEEQGLGTYRELILRSSEYYHVTAQVFKTAMRTRLVEQDGLEIVGAAGDQWSDINGDYTGYQMKVINHCYFIP